MITKKNLLLLCGLAAGLTVNVHAMDASQNGDAAAPNRRLLFDDYEENKDKVAGVVQNLQALENEKNRLCDRIFEINRERNKLDAELKAILETQNPESVRFQAYSRAGGECDGKYLLAFAIDLGLESVIKTLIDKGVEPNQEDIYRASTHASTSGESHARKCIFEYLKTVYEKQLESRSATSRR